MRRKELESFISEIVNKIEVIEYGSDGEYGNVYLDDFVKTLLEEYCKVASRDRLKDLRKSIKCIMKA